MTQIQYDFWAFINSNSQRSLENGIKLRYPGAEFNAIFYSKQSFSLPTSGITIPCIQKCSQLSHVEGMFREQVCLKKHHTQRNLSLLSCVCHYVSSGFTALSHVISPWLCGFSNNSKIVTHNLYNSLKTRTIDNQETGLMCSWRKYWLLFWITAKITSKTYKKFIWLHGSPITGFQLPPKSQFRILPSISFRNLEEETQVKHFQGTMFCK